jgi:peptidoglycan/LPS O-acetylase OafA/YrhL
MVTTALMAFGPRFLWNRSTVFTLAAVALDMAVGVGMILANKRYLAELDDLQRKVQLNSMGITLGVGLIVGVPFSVMDSYHMIPFHADIAFLLIVMALTFAASNLYGTRRYR